LRKGGMSIRSHCWDWGGAKGCELPILVTVWDLGYMDVM